MTAPPLAHRLAFSGSLPFIACASVAVAELPWLNGLGGSLAVGNLYAVLILAFMAGTHWGQALGDGAARGSWMFSNGVALAAFFVALLLPGSPEALCHALLFALLAAFDYRQWRAGRIDHAYWTTRWRVTALVVACLLVLAFSG